MIPAKRLLLFDLINKMAPENNTTDLNHLFSPLKLGNTTIPNRACFLAHRTNFAKKGRLTDQHIAYYTRRAQGKCGLIIMGELCIHPDDKPWESMIDINGPDCESDFKRLTDSVHRHGTAVFANINHHGFQSSGAISRKAIWGPSAVADIAFGETAKPMEKEDFDVLINAFSNAARIAKQGGFDGVEIDIGPESILRQFLSPLSNHRGDEYGGSTENRMRFPLQTVQAVRDAVDNDFTVGIRLCVDEKFWGAIEPPESDLVARRFADESGIDFINISVGTYYNLYLAMASMHTPFGFTIEAAERVKKTVNVPVIASHHISSPHMANEILQKGQADAAGMIRNLICDPDAILKAYEGRPDDIRHCVRDNKGCIGRVNSNKAIGCIQNPEVGREFAVQDSASVLPSLKKSVIVIGGGPAGLEAARTAAQRGHEVILYEKDEETGGQIRLISKRPKREGMMSVILYLRRMLEQLKVPIITNTNAGASFVTEQNPDAVIIATGSVPVRKPVPGDYGPPVILTVWDVLSGEYAVGEKILFIDENGGHHSASTVEFLADQGKNIHMVTSDLFIGIELASLGDLSLSRQRLLQKGVIFQTDVLIDEIQGSTVKARDLYTNNPLSFSGYDNIILDMGNTPEDRIYKELKGKVKEIYRAGDCVAPRGIDMAIIEGRKAGEKI